MAKLILLIGGLISGYLMLASAVALDNADANAVPGDFALFLGFVFLTSVFAIAFAIQEED